MIICVLKYKKHVTTSTNFIKNRTDIKYDYCTFSNFLKIFDEYLYSEKPFRVSYDDYAEQINICEENRFGNSVVNINEYLLIFRKKVMLFNCLDYFKYLIWRKKITRTLLLTSKREKGLWDKGNQE